MPGAAPAKGGAANVLATAAGAASAAFLVGLVLYLAGRPLYTDDLWFHLKAGETYANEGLWPEADPMLHTAHEDAPVQHEWLFGVAVHGIERAIGFHGLRVVHALAVAGILWLAFSLLRRESRAATGALLPFCAFAVLAWWRLFQFRPDLVSIPATLILYRLLLESETPPSWRRVGASGALFLVWANAHSLFGVGLALLLAALLGYGLHAALARAAPAARGSGADAGRRARRVGAALGLGVLVTALNPRGFAHHLTFVTSSRETAIWAVRGEWTHFDPFSWGHYGPAVSLLAFVVTDVLLAAFAGVALGVLFAVLRRRGRVSVRASDVALFGLGLASLAAILVSIRFLWMSIFPLLLLLRVARRLRAGPPRAALRLAAAAACVALAAAFPRAGAWHRVAAGTPRQPAAYLSLPYLTGKYYFEGVRFLRETGVAGNLFNSYGMGGFLGYWTAPELRTFIDGRTEHYPPAVLRDYFSVNYRVGAGPRETFLDVLDRRRVDFFFGVGLPVEQPPQSVSVYTTAHLERAPGWVLVQRALDHAIHLRRRARNRANFRRIAAFYGREGVPFDAARGLDPGAVLRERPDWAAAHGMLPPDYARRLLDRESPDPARRLRALETLSLTHALLGLYESQLGFDREAVRTRPDAAGPRRRIVYALLHLDRPAAAIAAARELRRVAPGARSEVFLETAERYARLRREAARGRAELPPEAVLGGLPLLSQAERVRFFTGAD